MTPERWQQLKDVLAGALARSGEEQSAYLDEIGAQDPELRREAEVYLAAGQVESFLAQPGPSLSGSSGAGAPAIGSRLGPYEVTSLLGRGGMGEVFRARDTRLHRDVALKILPESLADDPERLARFRREAQVLASLNHPNIGAIHGLEETPSTSSGQGSVTALVLELVEGPTLADRIAEGPVPVAEALSIATQITEALEAAHEAGIIHRDLKPANIKLRPDGGRDLVKVLDFGLAKPAGLPHALSPSQLTASPTVTTPAQTVQGVILGTAAYMSPEQAKGKPVDKRTDIWAFGCVLFEMLTGQRVFDGESVTESLGAVMHKVPEWETLPADVPSKVRRTLERCLEKDPQQRLRDIADVRLALGGAFETAGAGAAAPAAPSARRLGAVGLVGLAAGGLLAAGLVWALTPAPAPEPGVLARTIIPTPPEAPFELSVGGYTPYVGSRVALSSDGRRLVYTSNRRDEVRPKLVVRDLDSLEVRDIPGTETGLIPVFSPDSTSIAFWHSDGTIKRASLLGGTPTTVATSIGLPNGLSWSPDDDLVFAHYNVDDPATTQGIYRVPASGGMVEMLSAERRRWPYVLPNGRGVLFQQSVGEPVPDEFLVQAESLDSGEVTTLWSTPTGSESRGGGTFYYANGHLLYGLRGTIWAVSFDPDRLAVTGEPVPLIEGIRSNGQNSDFSVSETGALVYATPPAVEVPMYTLAWVDRDGQHTPLPFAPGSYSYPALSPDGRRLAITREGLWILDLERGTETSSLPNASTGYFPVWSRDGRTIFSARGNGQVWDTFSQPADGTSTGTLVLEDAFPLDVTPDGQSLVVGLRHGGQTATADWDIGVLPLDGQGPLRTIVDTEGRAASAKVSPDGAWFAYDAEYSGQSEVYVERFPDGGDRQPVSVSGGAEPRWVQDEDTLFLYWSVGGPNTTDTSTTYMRAPVTLGPRLEVGDPETLLAGPYRRGGSAGGAPRYEVSAGADRILVIEQQPGDPSGAQIVYVQNWPELLRRVEAGN